MRHSPRQVVKLPNRPAERGRRRPRSTTCACPGDLQHPRDNGSRYFACRILCSKLSLANQQALLVFALPTSMLKLPWNLGNVRPGRTSRRRFFSAGALEPRGASFGGLYRAMHLDTPSVCSIVTHGQILAPRSGPSLNASLLRRVLGASCDSLRDAPFQNSYARSTRRVHWLPST